jgi:hypothetical protein
MEPLVHKNNTFPRVLEKVEVRRKMKNRGSLKKLRSENLMVGLASRGELQENNTKPQTTMVLKKQRWPQK